MRALIVFCAVSLLGSTLPRVAFAQAFAQPGGVEAEITPPVLKTRRDAAYPDEASRKRVEATVGLELTVAEDGTVADVTVTAPAGHGFDEAAVLAARDFVFEPARQNGNAIRSVVQFSYEFHLPPEPLPADAAPPPAEVEQRGEGQSTLVLAQRPITAASSFSVREREFRLRPIGSVADILRITPGILVVQHAGGGKANQYFLRGFDADHGTDLALSIDGIPINMVSHAHGQGYADTSFIIPEIVDRVEITKGPYFSEQGDFATAGTINLVTKRELNHSSIGFGYGGSPGYGGPAYRGLLVASPSFDDGRVKPLFVAEAGRSNGPFHNPERFDRYKLFAKVTYEPSKESTLTVGASSYAGDWHGSGQIPNRQVSAGRLDRFATLDPSEGGSSSRHQLFASYRLRTSEKSQIEASSYLAQYRLSLVSNFTGYLADPVDGDQITQKDRRTFAGGKAQYRIVETLGSVRFDTALGVNLRTDSIKNALERSRQRELLGPIRDSRIQQTSIGTFVREEVSPFPWLRGIAGARADFFSFDVDDALEQPKQAEGATSGSKGASQASPKASVVLSPLRSKSIELDVYGNYGHGFHSNDGRGVVRSLGAARPLTRAIGYEAGTRARLWDRWDLAAALWRLDLSSETVFVGDEGTTEASDASRRYGVELETRFAITPWLSADLDLTATKSAFVVNRGNGDAIALAPRYTWAGGLSARHPTGVRGGLRFYGVGDRPATADEVLTAEGFTVFDLHAGYGTRRWDVGVDVENLFNAKYRSAQFATTSRLRDEPPTNAPPPPGTCGFGSRAVLDGNAFAGCEDVNFTPGLPLTLRVMTTLYLD
jgi:TonB family protein